MSARVLVVDDVLPNVKLLEAKLSSEYFDVVTASNGPDALVRIRETQPDIVLLDVMMPGMDGFEVCRRMKADPDSAHIPVVMVTALDQASDRVNGLEAGADDFLTKPVNDVALFARVRSLVRLKMMTDELRMREATSNSLGVIGGGTPIKDTDTEGARILIVEDRQLAGTRMADTLAKGHDVQIEGSGEEAAVLVRGGDYDLVVVSLSLKEHDGLRLCSQMRSSDATRNTPILVLVEDGDSKRLVRALDLGVNDYLIRPIDRNELMARAKTQIKRKRYADRLRQNYHLSMAMAVTDSLTGLYNRRYTFSHLDTLLDRTQSGGKPVALLVLDIDFFKLVNDSYGHPVGDRVLVEFAGRINRNVRGVDLASRYGGEEFVVVMPDTDLPAARQIAERLRQAIAEAPFEAGVDRPLNITVSIGVASSNPAGDTADSMFKRADDALYAAKRGGRNRVEPAGD
ncbi:PleD family two-component system response regulator [Zavarzinia sp. CC-PAN008]|uniref:PleD family two-component system response regulator n=1 Tax=Zavarzinia sp. CC-PAN008 TaxID=3243332 RepID=UPI003F7457BE